MCASANPELRLFISYASVDRTAVLAKVQALNDRRMSAWVDLDAITPGESYGPEIADGIRNADAVLLMCSKASLASRNVRQEIQLAWKFDRPIVPILLEQLAFPDELAYWLEGAQWIDATVLEGDAWIDRVLDALIKRGIAPDIRLPASEPGSAVPYGGQGNLPREFPAPIGRDRELKRLIALISNSRLVTVTGPGGVGKTTVAIEAARRLATRYPDGIWLVDAATTTSTEELISEIASTMMIPTSATASSTELVAEFVRDLRVLLILDNLEQNRGAGETIAELLRFADSLIVLATSRLPLRVQGEAHFPLAGFDAAVDASGKSASELADLPGIALFVERARAARPGFLLTDGNATAVAEICKRLDGLPLAIELAAARSRLLPPASILERLDSALDLGNRDAGARSDRQQTLRSTIQWSYDLLESDEQTTFRELAIFEGGFTSEAAEGICSDPNALEKLETLLDHHLVASHGFNVLTDSPRFRMLETVRAFARESLEADGERPKVEASHLAWFHSEINRVGPVLESGSDPAVLDAIAADHANIKKAVATAIDQSDNDAATDIVVILVKFWLARGQLREGVEFATTNLETIGGLSDTQKARLLQIRAVMLETSGNLAKALDDWKFSVDMARSSGEWPLLAIAHGGMGTVSEASGDFVLAAESYQSALAIHREHGNTRGIATSLHYLGSLETLRGNYTEAREYCVEAERLWRTLGELVPLSYSILQGGILSFLDGEYIVAIERYEEALDLVESIGDQYGIGTVLINLGSAQEMVGKYPESISTLTNARSIFLETGDAGGAGYAEYLLGHVGRLTGDPMAISRLSNALATLREVGDQASMALIHETLAGLAVDRRDKQDAEAHFIQADRLRAQTEAAIPGSRIEEVERDRKRLAQL